MYMYNDSHVNYICINEILGTCIAVLLMHTIGESPDIPDKLKQRESCLLRF